VDEQKLKEAFGRELRKARHTVGLSQEKLALQVGLDRTYISMLERGVRQPSLKTIFLLCSSLGVRGSELIQRIENEL